MYEIRHKLMGLMYRTQTCREVFDQLGKYISQHPLNINDLVVSRDVEDGAVAEPAAKWLFDHARDMLENLDYRKEQEPHDELYKLERRFENMVRAVAKLQIDFGILAPLVDKLTTIQDTLTPNIENLTKRLNGIENNIQWLHVRKKDKI
jgi:hypothetical protein